MMRSVGVIVALAGAASDGEKMAHHRPTTTTTTNTGTATHIHFGHRSWLDLLRLGLFGSKDIRMPPLTDSNLIAAPL
jgi:hypothetical protein